MSCILLVGAIAIPVAIIAREDPIAYVFVLVGIICVICISVLTLIFVPKILYNREISKEKQNPSQSHSKTYVSWGSTAAGTSPQCEKGGKQPERNTGNPDSMNLPQIRPEVIDRRIPSHDKESSSDDDSSEIGLSFSDRRQMLHLESENKSLRQINKRLENHVVLLESQRNLFPLIQEGAETEGLLPQEDARLN